MNYGYRYTIRRGIRKGMPDDKDVEGACLHLLALIDEEESKS